MDEVRLHAVEQQMEEHRRLLQKLDDGQVRILNALVGSLDKSAIGLIEETRTLRKEVDVLNRSVQIQTVQIDELESFKRDIKKIVAGIALFIPFAFELFKLSFATLWELISKKP